MERSWLPTALLLCLLAATAAPVGGETMLIDGVDHYRVMEPLFECVRVVLSYRGESFSPAYVQGISGAAFRIAGPCPCAPTCSAAMDTHELPGLLGYDTECLPLWGEGVDPQEDVHEVVARIKDEIRAGRPVLVWHAFTSAEWDVVCGFDDETKQFLGRGSYAGLDAYAEAEEGRTATCLNICPALGAILIGEKTGDYNAREAELAALEEAVRHSRHPEDPLLAFAEKHDREAPWRFREGLPAYHWWINSFQANPQKVPSAGDRYSLSVYRTTHRAASAFMRELVPNYPDVAPYFRRAAEHFEAEADALDECHGGLFGGWEGWQQPDPDKSARAAQLLTQARGAYANGMKEIALALQAIDPMRAAAARATAGIIRSDGRAEIRHVPLLRWHQGKDCTFAGALEAALSVTAHPYTYADIMGLTGLAFRVRWCNDDTKTKWCPSCAVGEMPDEQALATKLTGWQLPTDWSEAESRDHDQLRARMVASVDAGKPVALYATSYDMAVVYGYEDHGRTLLVRDYTAADPSARVPISDLGPLHTYLGDHVEAPPLPDALREVLRAAVRNWQRARHHGGLPDREYWYGDAALAAWIEDLRGYEALSDDARNGLMGIDPWNYTSLFDARKAAVQFLRDWSVVLDDDARAALERAAQLYEDETKALEPLLAAKRTTDEAAEPAAAEATDQWSDAARAREVEILSEARELERNAIGEIENALAAAG